MFHFIFVYHYHGDRDPHPFPTRRSADLGRGPEAGGPRAALRGRPGAPPHRRRWRGRGSPPPRGRARGTPARSRPDRKSTRLNSSHLVISYAVFCLKKKTIDDEIRDRKTV